MPKVKTHKGTAKRIKVTGTGKAISHSNFRNHITKAPKRTRKLRKANVVAESDMGRIKSLLPYEF
jgi:large subunit ribosomal protein L35